MGLSDDDVQFLDSKIDSTGVDAAADRVCKILWRRLTKVCMVIMPFAKDYDPLYRTLHTAILGAGLYPLRTDQLVVPIDIMDIVTMGIAACHCAIAVVDGDRPNVYYELGRAHAHHKPVLIVISEGTKAPFDIAGLSLVRYTVPNRSFSRRIEDQLKTIAKISAPAHLAFPVNAAQATSRRHRRAGTANGGMRRPRARERRP
jgi:hypothetical protein